MNSHLPNLIGKTALIALLAFFTLSASLGQSVIDANFDTSVDHAADIERTARFDQKLEEATKGIMSFSKFSVTNYQDGIQIPSYLFEPLPTERSESHAALVWVYGGVHDYFGLNYFPFIKQAVAQGYAVIVPEYRGASGYGEAYYNLLDYGGMEVEDIISVGCYVRDQLDYVNAEKIGVIGWSHGGYISLLSILREQDLFSAAVASVPVSNLVYRLSIKGPEYQALFLEQPTIAALPHENKELYLNRSPSHLTESLQIPLMVQFATNDDDVEFSEAKLLIDSLRSHKPELAEIVVYQDPEHGHYLNRQTNTDTLTIDKDSIQSDSWDKIWRFLKSNLNSL
ncbi:MAG: alpha/beta hydrolase family protein [Pseudohongiellaceae bacterium]